MAENKKQSRFTKYGFPEQLFPSRPLELWAKARTLAKKRISSLQMLGLPVAPNPSYVRWLKKESMLNSANVLAAKYSGSGHMWRNPYARPRPRNAIAQASVWYTAYPTSIITEGDESILKTLGNEKLWKVFKDIGIEGMHTGPMKLAGGIDGWKHTPSIDGHFDRISTRIDPLFGTASEFRAMTRVAAKHNCIIIDDIVPGHTGKGADFRLATMGYKEYPGIYHMVEIYPEDWALLPRVSFGHNSANLDQATEKELLQRGYIVGRLQRVIFYEKGVKETNWSVTKPVKGTDGIKRRWVYLHYFKEGQPSINWLDPTFAGMKLVLGDALHSLEELGTGALRLDANGFLGIEIASRPGAAAWSEGHPLSEVANQLIASMVRKVGGFTFQELNLSMDAIKSTAASGADLSYDFINRPAYHHALITGQTEFLKLTLRTSLAIGIDPASLVHALQNHDELTYELMHFSTTHKDDIFKYCGKEYTGMELCHHIRHEIRSGISGPNAPYNLLFGENGIACTTASVITAVLGYKSIGELSKTQVEQISKIHLLLCMFNALQPGVFAISGWDLSGSLTLPKDSVKDLIAEGDNRWINRGSYDLLDLDPGAEHSSAGMPKSVNLYGSLTEQFENPQSFVHKLRTVLAIRKRYGIAVSHQIAIPDTSDVSTVAMLHRLRDDSLQMTVLNFSGKSVCVEIQSQHLPVGYSVTDMLCGDDLGTIKSHSLTLDLGPYEGASLLILKHPLR